MGCGNANVRSTDERPTRCRRVSAGWVVMGEGTTSPSPSTRPTVGEGASRTQSVSSDLESRVGRIESNIRQHESCWNWSWSKTDRIGMPHDCLWPWPLRLRVYGIAGLCPVETAQQSQINRSTPKRPGIVWIRETVPHG